MTVYSWIDDAFAKFWEILYSFYQGILSIVDAVERVYMILSGVEKLDGNHDILEVLFNHDIVKSIFAVFCIVGLLIFFISLIVALIKAAGDKEANVSAKKVVMNCAKACLWIASMPVLIYLSLVVINVVLASTFETIGDLMGTSGTDTVIADSLWRSFFKPINNLQTYEELMNTINEQKFNFLTPYHEFADHFNMQNGQNYDYVFAFIAACIILVSLGMGTIMLVERIINLVVLYFTSVPVVSAMPLDEGKRFDLWKDQVLSKMLGVVGSILAMYTYILVIGAIGSIIDNTDSIQRVVYITFLIGGAFTVPKGNQIISSLIAQGLGTQDGMSQLQTGQMLGMGLRLGGKGLALAGGAAGLAAKAGLNVGKFGVGSGVGFVNGLRDIAGEAKDAKQGAFDGNQTPSKTCSIKDGKTEGSFNSKNGNFNNNELGFSNGQVPPRRNHKPVKPTAYDRIPTNKIAGYAGQHIGRFNAYASRTAFRVGKKVKNGMSNNTRKNKVHREAKKEQKG